MLEICVVGIGKMGLLHASILNSMPGVKVTTACEKKSLVRHFGRSILPGIKLIDDVAALAGSHLDAVYVTTPPGSHYAVVETILSKGISKNIFIEKPLSTNSAQSLKLCDMIKEVNGIGMVGYHKRSSVVFKKAKEILDRNNLPQPTFFEAYAYSSDFLGARKDSKSSRTRGGVLKDHGCHAIDLALWLMGDLIVQGSGKPEPPIGGDPQYSGFARVVSAQGVPGEIRVSSAIEGYRLPEMGLRISGNGWRLHVNDDCVTLDVKGEGKQSWYRQDLNEKASFLLGEPEYSVENEAFIQAVKEGRPAEPSFDTGSRVDLVIEQIEKAGD